MYISLADCHENGVILHGIGQKAPAMQEGNRLRSADSFSMQIKKRNCRLVIALFYLEIGVAGEREIMLYLMTNQ